MVYDIIPPVASAIGNVEVNASIYSVDCLAASPNLTQISGYMDEVDVDGYQYQIDLRGVANYSVPQPGE